MKKTLLGLALFAFFSLFNLSAYNIQPIAPGKQLPPIFYPDNYHFTTTVSAVADMICIEDESVWKLTIPCHCLLQWKESDPLMISPNDSWLYSSYGKYKITNLLTKQTVYVNQYFTPKKNNKNTLYIKSIDQEKGKIELTNSSTWLIHPKDYRSLSDWEVNDAILIGSCEGKASSWSEYFWYGNKPMMDHILINFNIDSFVKVQNIK